jgi:quercetin dioxygenase-like cupin family protein
MSNEVKRSPVAHPPLRRIVTGLDADGRSCILADDAAKMLIWQVSDLPADNSGNAEQGACQFSFPKTGAQFIFSDLPPGVVSPMHATDTIDFVVVLSGSIVFVTETGETLLHAGDVLVDRGIVHAWRNDGDEACRIVTVLCPAHPIGAGAKGL